MKLITILLIAAVAVSCQNINDKPVTNNQTAKSAPVTKTVIAKAESPFDSSIRTFHLRLDMVFKNRDARDKSNEYAIKYYQTGEERFRLLANMYDDSCHYWYLESLKIK